MKQKKIGRLLACAILIAALGSPGFAAQNLSGQWKLDEKQSDNPREKFEEAMRNGRNEKGWGGGRHGDWGGPGGRSGGFGGPDRDRGERMRMLDAPMEITIADNDPEFRIIDNSGVDRTFYTDGRKTEIELNNERKAISVARRDADSVIVETQGPNGGKITQTYELSPDAQQLFVKLRIPMPMGDQTVTIIRVYNRVPEPATQTHPAEKPSESN